MRGLVLLCVLLSALPAVASPPDAALRESVREFVEAGTGVGVGDRIEPTYAVLPIFWFYEGRAFEPAWSDANRERLLEAIDALVLDGLRPAGYHRHEIDQLSAAIEQETDARRIAARDVLLTDAWFTAAQHLLAGRVDPRSIGAEWFIERPERELAPLLTEALATGEIEANFESLRPADPAYRQLREALRHYRAIDAEGGWAPVPASATLAPGSTGPAVAALRGRLAMTGDLGAGAGDQFDGELRNAVRRFQRRHGLTEDGVAGPVTIEALNVPVSSRIDGIVANLERWRWLPTDLGDEHVLVNLAGFTLHVVEDRREVMAMRVVTGRSYRKTPVLSSELTHIVFNPAWNVPPIIAATDLLQKVKADPGYLTRNGFRVYSGNREIDPSKIAWSRLSESSFPYQLRQDPGPQNALGRIKLVFPNRFKLYLHDSPEKELFRRESRDFSSGCIRVERPIDLANHLLGGSASPRIRSALSTSREQTVTLSRPVPIHILYWTSWIDDDGLVHFRPDVYHRDERLLTALRASAPEAR